jgi:hypothetical protein
MQVKVAGVVGKITKLFSVDLVAALQQHHHAHGGPVALQWKWRPVPLGTYNTTGAVLTLPSLQPTGVDPSAPESASRTARARARKASFAEASDNAAFFQIGSLYSVYWEVRVMHNHQELFRHREPVAPTSATARSVLQRSPDWIKSGVVLNDLHAKGTVEVYVTCLETSATAVTTEASLPRVGKTAPKKFVGFEGSGLSMSAVPLRPYYPCGGDALNLSADLCSIAGRKYVIPTALHALYPDLAGFSVVRRLRWTLSSRGRGKLQWQARLQSDGHTATASTSNRAGQSDARGEQQDYPPDHLSLGYAWAVLVCPAEGGAHIAAEGVCTAQQLAGEASGTDRTSTHDKLKAWLWTDCEAQLDRMHVDDCMFLAVKAISQQPNYPAAVLKRCVVAVRSVCCLAYDPLSAGAHKASGEEEDDEMESHKTVRRVGEGLPCDLDFAALLAVHDDVQTCVPL